MIKRIIFDIDNTLIMWKDSYLEALKNACDEFKVKYDYLKMNDVIDSYENYYDRYSKEDMLDLINNKCGLKLKIDFIDKWLDGLSVMSEYDSELVMTLSYLSKKYELVILTNWFTDNQKSRLKHAKILKFFKEVYGGEEFTKPSSVSYLTACGINKIKDCLMIGDNFNIDIEGAVEIGLPAIWITKDGKKGKGYKVIKDINELKKIL